MKPSPQQLKKLERLAKVLDNGDVELLTMLDELSDKTDSEIKAIQAVVTEAVSIAETTKKMKGDNGVDGKQGEKGERGTDGKDGKNGLDGKNGATGAPGKDGKDGKDAVAIDGLDGLDGKDGEDGFVDDATVAYLEAEIKELEERIRKVGAGRGSMLGRGAVQTIVRELITVGDTAPIAPTENDIWIDTNAYSYRAVTGTYTITPTDYMLDCSGTFTITLPTAVGFTGEYVIKNSGTGTVTLDATGSETIDGELMITIVSQWETRHVRSDGANWIEI